MERFTAQCRGRRRFHDPSVVHDGHPIAHVLHERQIMGNEETRQAKLLTKVGQEIDHLSADRDVEGTHRFVQDDQLGFHGQGPGNPDALSLPATEFVGVSTCMLSP
jgi:hypothetical protein